VIKLICFLRRKQDMSEADFHSHWREVHGPLVKSTKSGQYAVAYEQNHRIAGLPREFPASDFDGVTIQWYRSVDDFIASTQEPDYALIADDMTKFLDLERLTFILTEEAEVIWDDRSS
jgi:uncharacterized protein (TIGR02118 family)